MKHQPKWSEENVIKIKIGIQDLEPILAVRHLT
jgi:hypothetical protein